MKSMYAANPVRFRAGMPWWWGMATSKIADVRQLERTRRALSRGTVRGEGAPFNNVAQQVGNEADLFCGRLWLPGKTTPVCGDRMDEQTSDYTDE
jgi:hypothetical protein